MVFQKRMTKHILKLCKHSFYFYHDLGEIEKLLNLKNVRQNFKCGDFRNLMYLKSMIYTI